MRIRNKITKVMLLCTLMFTVTLILSGCDDNSSGDTVQRYAWPLGTGSPEDTVTQILAEKFAEEVGRISEGKMKIQVYPNSVLGGDRELLESCKDGDIPFVVQNTAPQVAFMKEAAVFDLPCAFSTIEEVREAIDDEEFISTMKGAYKNAGYQLLGYADQGFRVMSTNKLIATFKDFKGQKIRTMENAYHIGFWKSLNTSPTPMTFSEVYIGLQQKTIDAQENPYEVVVSNRLYEQQKYIIQTNHLPHLISLIISDKFYKGLSEQQQEIIDKASKIAIEYARKASDERVFEKMEVIKETGTEIIEVSEELRQQMLEASDPVYNSIRKLVGDKLVDSYIR